jgi:stalled ribosome rescue protein Dom34
MCSITLQEFMKTNHVVIWIDHQEAHVLYFDSSKNELIKSQSKHNHLHHKANEVGNGNAPKDHEFFHKVMAAVSQVNEILIIGPGSAKHELSKHALAHDPSTAKMIVGVETVDHPTDPQVMDYARKYFERIDQMRGDLAI